MTRRPSVLIAHPDRLAIEVLAAACARRGVAVVGEVCEPGPLPGLYHDLAPDVVVCGDRFGDTLVDGVLTELLASGARVIVLAGDQSPGRMVSLLLREIQGCCSMEAGPAEMADAIVTVAGGGAVLTPGVTRSLLDEWRRVGPATARRSTLTPREHEIVVAMVDGLGGKAIAARLGVSLKTVENHKGRVFEKLGVRSQAHAVSVALATGLVVGTAGEDSTGAPVRTG